MPLKKTRYLKLMWRRQWQPTPVLLPGKSHGRRSLVGCSPWGHEESDMTERLHFHFSLSCIGKGNGNPLQCSCLENPRDGGAWWAAVYGVARSRTRLKRLSSSSSSKLMNLALFHVQEDTTVWAHWNYSFDMNFRYLGASLVAQLVKNLTARQETWVLSLGWEDPLEKGKATYSSILA